MNVESTRALEVPTNDSSRERSTAKGQGFPALMASMLGGGNANAGNAEKKLATAHGRTAGDAASDRAARGEQGDASARAPRGPQSRDARDGRDVRDAKGPRAPGDPRALRPGRSTGRDRSASEDDADPAVEGSEATDPAPRAATSEGDDAPPAKAAAEETDPSQVVPTVEPAPWEVAAALALPELMARLGLSAGAAGTAEQGQGAVDEEVPAGGAVDAAAGAAQDESGIGDVTRPDAALTDPTARDAAIGLATSAQDGAASKEDASTEKATGAPQAASTATASDLALEDGRAPLERVVERTPGLESRPSPAIEAARRDPVDAPGLTTQVPGLRAAAETATEGGAGGGSQEQPNPGPTRGAPAAERSGADANAALGAAASAVTTAAGETAARAAESGAAGSAEALGAQTATPAASETNAALAPERIQAGNAAEAITAQADWLATRGGGSARLVLNPPDLGELVIRVSVRQQNVDVVMVAQTALGHSMAQDQSDRLAQAFAHRDLRLDQFEVRRADPGDANAGAGQFGSSDAGQRERERADDRELGFDFAAGRVGRRRSVGGGDAIAPSRPTPGGRASGIDLRI